MMTSVSYTISIVNTFRRIITMVMLISDHNHKLKNLVEAALCPHPMNSSPPFQVA